ncbi:MAG: extensin family protein [Rhodomicrobium sp.]
MRPFRRLRAKTALALAALFITYAPDATGAEARGLSPRRIAEARPSLLVEVRHRFRHRRRGRGKRMELSVPGRPSPPPPAGPTPPPSPPARGISKEPAKEPGTKPAAAAPGPMGPPPPPESWTAAEVDAGRLDCGRRLSGLHVLFEPAAPVKDGVCGTPAPIRLKGFDNGKEPSLMFSPAPLVTCKLAEALRRWADEFIQPNAKALLHAPVVRIATLSAYNCRTRYDNPAQRISQHAYANALDLSEFATAAGERIAVLDDWNGADERSAFLHEIHDGACEIFGTTLGPEANESHKNHFHLDMKERRRPLCDFTPEQIRAREEAKKHPPAKVPVSGAAGAPTASKPNAKPVPLPASR